MVSARVAGLSAVALATMGLSLGGCGPHSFRQATCVDVTDDCNWSVVIVRDDTPRAVVLRPCAHHCGAGDQLDDPITLASGQATSNSQYGGVRAPTGSLAWVAVQAATGRRLGCLVLDGHPDKRDGDVVLVSQVRPCGKHQPATRPVGRALVPSP